jgi:hypothetical protein
MAHCTCCNKQQHYNLAGKRSKKKQSHPTASMPAVRLLLSSAVQGHEGAAWPGRWSANHFANHSRMEC